MALTVLASALWPGLLAALALGAVVGAWTGWPRTRLARIAGVALAAGGAVLALAALSSRLPGHEQFVVESCALLLGLYLAGCLVGALAGALARRG